MKPNRNHGGIALIFAGILAFLSLTSFAMTTADMPQSARSTFILRGVIVGGTAVGIGALLTSGRDKLISYSLIIGGAVSIYMALNFKSTLKPEVGLMQLSFFFLAAVAFVNTYSFYRKRSLNSKERTILYACLGLIGVAILTWLVTASYVGLGEIILILSMLIILLLISWAYW